MGSPSAAAATNEISSAVSSLGVEGIDCGAVAEVRVFGRQGQDLVVRRTRAKHRLNGSVSEATFIRSAVSTALKKTLERLCTDVVIIPK